MPPQAYGPVLIVVGMFMIESAAKLDFGDYTELMPAFLTIVMMLFTFNIGVGITSGFISWVLLKLMSGRLGEIRSGMVALAVLSLTFYLFYP